MSASLSSESKSLPVHEMDTNILFEKFTIEEIRNIEKRTRSDIERKKEDLRTMVGERYRDLIEAADTITEMKTSAQNVMANIGKIESLCAELKQNQMVRGMSLHQQRQREIDVKRKEESRFYGIASQIKLLLDVPEKMWTCLDYEDYLTASRLYLLSQHINTGLHLDSQNAPNFLYWFPVLNRQWAAISHFKLTILQGCRRLLKEPMVSDQKIAESLCCILLLENSNPRQVFNEFLLARTSAVQQLFHASNQSTSTKDQICTVVRLITTTIHQIHAVFYTQQGETSSLEHKADESNLLLSILTKVTSEKQSESGILDLQSSVSFRCLPKSVTDFCPSHKALSLGVSEQHLHDNCKQWMQTSTANVKAGVTKLLSFVNTVKHLAAIRDTVWEIMAQDPHQSTWGSVCERVLGGSLCIWDDLLRPLFLSRVQALVSYQLEATVELTQRQVSKVISELENTQDISLKSEIDLASYIWCESPSDIAPNTAWGAAGSRSLLESGGLMMKAKAFTPVVQSLCKNFDEKLKAMNEDCKFYLTTDVNKPPVVEEASPFSRFKDTPDLLHYTQQACVNGVQRLLQYLAGLMTECQSLLATSDTRCDSTGIKLLLSGRLCVAMCHLVPSLQQCMMGADQLQDQTRSQIKWSSGSGRQTGRQDGSPLWEVMKTQLMDHQQTVYRVWLDHLAKIVLKEFSTTVSLTSPQTAIQCCSRWEEVSIEEENEAGKKVTSKILVPMQASWYVSSLLYRLCSDLNNIGGHAVGRSVLEYLVTQVSNGMVDIYTRLVTIETERPSFLNQHQSLQLLFDVKFLSMILPRKDDTTESRSYREKIAKIVASLEENIDPFDLDVFSPFIQANLTKLAQRSAVLLGSLTSLDKSMLYGLTSRPAATSTTQEQHNVLLLSRCQSRFSLLPLSSQQSKVYTPQPVVPQTLYRGMEAAGPSLTETAAAVLPQHNQQSLSSSSSFYDKIGTGLGSMTEISNWFSTIGSK